jgi:hypothetical protein
MHPHFLHPTNLLPERKTHLDPYHAEIRFKSVLPGQVLFLCIWLVINSKRMVDSGTFSGVLTFIDKLAQILTNIA